MKDDDGARLDSQVAIVTGAGRGIGRGIARALAADGARVAVADRDHGAAAAACREIQAEGGRASAFAADVTDERQVSRLVAETVAVYGPVGILVNNAGINRHQPIMQMTLNDWHEMLNGNLTAAFLCCRAVLPGMIERRYGRIVNLGSQLGEIGGAGMTHYTAAKAGIHGFTKALAREVASTGVTVNAVAPGPVETDNLLALAPELRDALLAQLPLGRFATVAEVAPTVALLASDDGGYYTGAVLNVSGGHWM